MVFAEEGFDEDRRFVAVPGIAHGDTTRTFDGAAEGLAKVGDWEFGDHRFSERTIKPSAVAGHRRALVGPKTVGLVIV
jgi:hypothetical protein